MSELGDLFKKKKEEQENKDTKRLEAIRSRRDLADNLMKTIAGWLPKPDDTFRLAPHEVQVDEYGLGVYQVPGLSVVLGSGQAVSFVPRGWSIMTGLQVDVRVGYQIARVLVSTGVDAGWFFSPGADALTRAGQKWKTLLTPLTKEAFEKMMKELLG